MNCKNCQKEIIGKTSRAVFCSDSCRVNYHQKQYRIQQKAPISNWFKTNISKIMVYLLLFILAMAVLPSAFSKMMNTYAEYRLTVQNDRLVELENQIKIFGNKPRLIEENKKLKLKISILLDSKNQWMDKESIATFRKQVLNQ